MGKIVVQISGNNERSRSGSPVLGPGEILRAGQSSSGVGVGNDFRLSQEDIAGVNFEHQRRVQFEACVVERHETIAPILLGSKWSCLLPRIVLQDALGEVTKIYPSLNLRVFEDNITVLMKGRNKS